jgi:hypothetical protein
MKAKLIISRSRADLRPSNIRRLLERSPPQSERSSLQLQSPRSCVKSSRKAKLVRLMPVDPPQQLLVLR